MFRGVLAPFLLAQAFICAAKRFIFTLAAVVIIVHFTSVTVTFYSLTVLIGHCIRTYAVLFYVICHRCRENLLTGNLLLFGSLSIQNSHMQPRSISFSRDGSRLPMGLQWKFLYLLSYFEAFCWVFCNWNPSISYSWSASAGSTHIFTE